MCHVHVQQRKNENKENANRKEQEKLAIHRENGSVSILYFFLSPLFGMAPGMGWLIFIFGCHVSHRNIQIRHLDDWSHRRTPFPGSWFYFCDSLISATWKCNDLPSLTYEGEKTHVHFYRISMLPHLERISRPREWCRTVGMLVVLCWYAMHRLIQQIRERPKKKKYAFQR